MTKHFFSCGHKFNCNYNCGMKLGLSWECTECDPERLTVKAMLKAKEFVKWPIASTVTWRIEIEQF